MGKEQAELSEAELITELEKGYGCMKTIDKAFTGDGSRGICKKCGVFLLTDALVDNRISMIQSYLLRIFHTL